MAQHLVCEKRKTYFAYTPKCGVESLILLVLKEQGEENVSEIWTKHIKYMRKGKIPSGYTYISICRDPYNRLVSAYIDKFLTGNYKLLPFCRKVANHYNRNIEDPKRVSFEELINFLINEPKHSTDGHFATQISSINVSDNPEIYKLENIDSISNRLESLNFENKFDNYRHIYLYGWEKSDIKDAHKMYFNDFEIYDELRGYSGQNSFNENNNHGVMPYYDNFYNEDLKEKVYNFYKEDFEYFNYDK